MLLCLLPRGPLLERRRTGSGAVSRVTGLEILLASNEIGPQNEAARDLHSDCMNNRLRKLVAWTLLTQVTLVGGLGTGLHGLFGCEHGASGCTATCCVTTAASSPRSDCEDCVYCRHAADGRSASSETSATADQDRSLVTPAGCDGCAVCDLLAQYHSVTPFEIGSLSIELASGEAALQRHNAVVAAAIRLAFSRGPPVV